MKKQILFIFAMLVAASARAAVGDTFTASTAEGVTMTFSVTDEENKTCQVGSDFAECCVSQDTRGALTIPQTANGYEVTAIAPFAFYHCRLNAIVIPESVMEIGEYAFYFSYLESIEIPLGVTVLKANTFEYCVALSSVTLHEGIESVERSCFKDCKSLHSIALPQSLRTIGHNAFQGCQSLEEMTIPEGVEEIPAAAFVECGALRDVRLPESLKRIDDMAFLDCRSLDSISLPSGLTELGRVVFGYGPLTAYRLFCETPPMVDETTFMGNYDSRLYVPTGCADAYKNAEVWKNFKEIVEFDTNHITGIRIPVFQETIFDLQGRHLASPPNKGVYIQDGKKYVK